MDTPLMDALPLDPSFYSLSEHEAEFFKTQTGIQDDEELKRHLLQIQRDAYDVCPYPCIRRFHFVRLKISLHPAYKSFLKLGIERSGIFLDIGCCFGNDIRKAVLDGYPVSQTIASDLREEFWELGHQLFRSTQDTFPATFVCGNILDDNFLDPSQSFSPLYNDPSFPTSIVPSSLQSLTPLKGGVSAIHVAALFHLFSEDDQRSLARRLALLLSTQPGSMIFGSQVSRPSKGFRTEAAGLGGLAGSMFCHSDRSWIDLWDGEIFDKGLVKVEAKLEETVRADLEAKPGVTYYQLIWSVTRL